MPVSLTQGLLGVALLATLATVWYFHGRGRWRAFAADRLLFGVPWGTLVTVAVVVTFYLVVQSGLWNWANPVVYAFVSWSYFYPFGVLTAGIAHAGPDHLVSNMTATLALAPIAEYAWGHYVPSRGSTTADGEASADDEPSEEVTASTAARRGQPDRPAAGRSAPTAENSASNAEDSTSTAEGDDPATDDAGSSSSEEHRPDGGERRPESRGLFGTPWIRALVLFPAALLGAALLTSVFSMGPGLGFSGAVYAILGFAVVTYPMATVVAVVASAALGVLYEALTRPLVQTTVEVGTPSPPSWAGVGFQAHALGFLVGVLVGVAVLAYRHRRRDASRVFFATLAVGLVQSLWLISWSSGDTYTLSGAPASSSSWR